VYISNETKALPILERAALPLGSKDSQTINPVEKNSTRAKRKEKVFPPHEHFGSPLNVCRICGQKYSYVQKPFGSSPAIKD
jgi:ribosomal protein S14